MKVILEQKKPVFRKYRFF